ncbi:hypothetical protein GCM10023330_29030 [Litoribaculum gwangyangense]|uniref:Uncharacterized protein n=1 Tax=Litoribaculum gwangyangense TaxID=1130722 RepID=A0ABP9CT51_9FLAO
MINSNDITKYFILKKFNSKIQLPIILYRFELTKIKTCVVTSQFFRNNVPLQIERVGLVICCGDMILKYYNM